MSDLISREALLDAMRKENVLKVYECIKLVDNAPAIEADSGEAVCYVSKKVLQSVLDKNAGLVPVWYEKDSVSPEALFRSPQKQWVGLTTRQIKHIEEKSYVLQTGVNDYEFDFIHFAKAIEAKLKELNHDTTK